MRKYQTSPQVSASGKLRTIHGQHVKWSLFIRPSSNESEYYESVRNMNWMVKTTDGINTYYKNKGNGCYEETSVESWEIYRNYVYTSIDEKIQQLSTDLNKLLDD